MENERDTQKNELNIPAPTVQGESPENGGADERSAGRQSSGHSGSSHHRSSSGHSGSSHHRSSSEHSSGTHHRSSGEHGSGSHHSSSHSSGKSHGKKHRSRYKHSDRDKITFEERLKRFKHTVKANLYKYKPKYLYRKFKHRFKKASLQKKIGYIVLIISFFIGVGLFTKLALVDNFVPDGSSATTAKVTRTKAPVKPVAPKVALAYELNDTGLYDSFESGFIVKLPKIAADTPVVTQINIELDALKENIKAKNREAGNLNEYPGKYDYSYFSFSNDSILFLSIYMLVESAGGESDVTHKYYVYNYIEDRLVTDYSLTSVYNYSEMQMLDVINTKLDAIGSPQIESTQGLEFSVNKEGKLCALLYVNNNSGGKAPILVPLG